MLYCYIVYICYLIIILLDILPLSYIVILYAISDLIVMELCLEAFLVRSVPAR